MSFRALLLTFIVIFRTAVQGSEDEQRLIHYLFSERDYNPLIRPIQYSNQTVVVSFGLLLVQLIHVYEKEQIMKTNTWLHMKWNDPQLRWNPERYGGIEKINIPFPKVWTPDVVLFNNADGNYEVSFKSKVVLMHSGEVNWVPPAIYKSSCRIDVKYFPFDTQECEMRFASWTYNAREVTFAPYPVDDQLSSELINILPQQGYTSRSQELHKDDYQESGTWDVLGVPSKFVHYRFNASSEDPDYIEVVFQIKMSRKTLYYTVNLLVPTGLMSVLICIVFCLPTAAGEKMTLCMSVLLALNLFQLLVTRLLPPTSAVVPLIAKYLLFTFTLNVLVIVNTVIITNFYYRTPMTHSMPHWVRWFFLKVLPPILWMASKPIEELPIADEEESEMNTVMMRGREGSMAIPMRTLRPRERFESPKDNQEHYYLSYIHNKRRTSTMLIKSMSYSTHSLSHQHPNTFQYLNDPRSKRRLRRDLRQALKNIRYIAAHVAYESFIESLCDEWKFIAIVFDRLQFIIFSLVTLIATFTLFFQVPHFFHINCQHPEKLVRFSNPNTTVNQLIRVPSN